MAYVPPSDWELKDFVRDHADAVYRSCCFLTAGQGDAQAMTREIFRKVLCQGMEFRSERDARAWMILTAYQMGRKLPKDAAVPEQGRELLKLRRKERLVALLYYCEGYRKKEIADYLGCPESRVRHYLARVKRKLAAQEPEEPEEETLKPEEEAPAETAAEEAAPAQEAPVEAVAEEKNSEAEAPEQEGTEEEGTCAQAPGEEETDAQAPEEDPEARAAGEDAETETPAEDVSADAEQEEAPQTQTGGNPEC